MGLLVSCALCPFSTACAVAGVRAWVDGRCPWSTHHSGCGCGNMCVNSSEDCAGWSTGPAKLLGVNGCGDL